MSALDDIWGRARQAAARIVLPEGEDPRIIEGALRAAKDGLARPILLGDAQKPGAPVPGEIEVITPSEHDSFEHYVATYQALRAHKGIDMAAARRSMSDPLAFGAMMVRQGDADGSLAGAVATTADTVRTALQIIGRAPGAKLVSSFFIMMLDQPHHPIQGAVLFADCGLVIDPSSEELADIAINAADSCRALMGEEPRVAMLSFSTAGSARHDRVDRVLEATKLAQSLRPDLTIDGELQFDAAFVPDIAHSKAPNSPLQGRANIFVFPGLEAANIGYKIAQRIGGAKAIGPILQGLAKPANDLSRGCSADDVYRMIAITSAQTAP